MYTLVSAVITLVVAVSAFFFYGTYVRNHPASPEPLQTGTHADTFGRAVASVRADESGKNLTKMPEHILTMTDLQELDLSHNALTGALPSEIRRLQNLEMLDISDNMMTGLPAEIGQLSKLRILNASNNQLTGLPHELGNLRNLEVLDLSGNDISNQDLEIIRSKLPTSTRIIL